MIASALGTGEGTLLFSLPVNEILSQRASESGFFEHYSTLLIVCASSQVILTCIGTVRFVRKDECNCTQAALLDTLHLSAIIHHE